MDRLEAEGELLADRAFKALRGLLTNGSLRAGQFVSMPDLTKTLGMPMAPVREAVKRAESASLVRILPKRGVAVMEATPESIKDCFHLRTILDQEGARELARAGEAGALAALRERHQRVLEAARDAITPSLQREAMEVDWALHTTLADALGNGSVREIYARNRDRISVIQHSRPLLPDRIIPAMEEHLEILDAISGGDEQAAAARVRDHFRQTLRWWGIIV
ncbi:GntR family transcriptional regulator [Cognatazoarcus halotolerans]|uniref:GntR family transcriptional regulator n=1 Tax=Cognatazoarcus halotolerans TaxID=2686016 RepID=UPI0013569FBD|nr:GntR family transcriptional regulator [Cognatazoarcus halotolerans]MCB1902240.1 GntR family transcriptional regulator [Rhodocyclaceae bacterium]MCP5309978.1 GntR family transcriptional regulator [Zoogloeaceae bacterium]